MAPSITSSVMSSEAPTRPLELDQNEYSFRYTQTAKLKNALEKAGRDFRSDVVTVPTEGIMQVGLATIKSEFMENQVNDSNNRPS